MKIQILITRELRDAINLHSENLGFDTLQDFTRVLYKTVIHEQLRFNLLSPTNQIAGTHVSEEDYRKYQQNKLGKYLKTINYDKLDEEY